MTHSFDLETNPSRVTQREYAWNFWASEGHLRNSQTHGVCFGLFHPWGIIPVYTRSFQLWWFSYLLPLIDWIQQSRAYIVIFSPTAICPWPSYAASITWDVKSKMTMKVLPNCVSMSIHRLIFEGNMKTVLGNTSHASAKKWNSYQREVSQGKRELDNNQFNLRNKRSHNTKMRVTHQRWSRHLIGLSGLSPKHFSRELTGERTGPRFQRLSSSSFHQSHFKAGANPAWPL